MLYVFLNLLEKQNRHNLKNTGTNEKIIKKKQKNIILKLN